MKKLLTIPQTAEALQISRQTVQRMVDEHALPALLLRSGKRKKTWRIDESDLERWMESQKTNAGQTGVTTARKIHAINR